MANDECEAAGLRGAKGKTPSTDTLGAELTAHLPLRRCTYAAVGHIHRVSQFIIHHSYHACVLP
jgi:hypothetical protein